MCAIRVEFVLASYFAQSGETAVAERELMTIVARNLLRAVAEGFSIDASVEQADDRIPQAVAALRAWIDDGLVNTVERQDGISFKATDAKAFQTITRSMFEQAPGLEGFEPQFT